MHESGFMGHLSDTLGPPRSMRDDWRWLVAITAGCYLFNLALRLSLWTLWDTPLLQVGDEFIMSTHDSYLWLAHARVAKFGDGRSLAFFTKLLHQYLGLSLGSIGFWGPAVLGSLLAIPCVLWGWLLGGRKAAIFAGIAGVMTPGFFARTKLGYYDTDLFTLFMPMLVAFLLAWWLRQRVSFRWLAHDELVEAGTWLPVQMLGIGLFARFAGWWHHDIGNYIVLMTLLAVGFGLVFCRRGKRVDLLLEASILMLSGIAGSVWVYHSPFLMQLTGFDNYLRVMMLSACALAIFQHFRATSGSGKAIAVAACGIFVASLFVSGLFGSPLAGVAYKLGLYLQPASVAVNDAQELSGPVYPRVTQSIIEAKLIPLDVVFERSAYYFWVGLGALAAMIPVLILRPTSVLLLPLVALSLLSMKMGIRFSMFGGGPLMVFLGTALTGMCFLALPARFQRRRLVAAGAAAALALCILLPKYSEYRDIPPTPVVDKAHAEALIGLGKRAPEDATVWTWWDWGYATQYYAGLKTPIDGGRHSGKDLYPTAVAMATDSPLQANQLVRYAAQFPQYDPSIEWNAESGKAAMQAVDGLKQRQDFPPVPTQYLAVSYKDIRIAKWIMFYGNWDLDSGTTHEGTYRRFGPGQMAVNLQIGGVMNRARQQNVIATADVLLPGKAEHYSYPRNTYSPRLVPKTPHLVFNKVVGEANFFDKALYDSMLVRLFAGDPESEDIKPYFRLVADGLPFIRIYEVVQN